MKIKKLTLQNFRGFRNLELEFHDRLTILVGINGTGKTSILDALAIGLSHWQARFYTFDGSQHPSKESHYSTFKKDDTSFSTRASDLSHEHLLPGQNLYYLDIYNGEDNVTCKFSVLDDIEPCWYEDLKDCASKFPDSRVPTKEGVPLVSWELTHFRKDHNGKMGHINTGEITHYLQCRPSAIPYLVYMPLDRMSRFFDDSTIIPNAILKAITDEKIPALETLKFIHEQSSKFSLNNPVSIIPSASFQNLLATLRKFQEDEQSNLHEMVTNGEVPTDSKSFQSQPLQSVIDAWKRLLPDGFSHFKVKKDDSGRFFLSIKKNGIDITDSQLSDGEKGLLALVGAITVQLSYRTDKNAFDKPGIILIDEIELHLHPKWQREVIPRLLDVFPNCQLIVTTHSPQVLGGIREGKIVLLTNAENGNISYKSYEENIFGMSSNDILNSLMGGGERDKNVAKRMKEFYGALEKEDTETARTVLEKLKKETDIPELEAMGMRLRRKEFIKNEIYS